ncbi:hypothetical protein [Deinococcus arcticus]|uniref:hypothetical protein n=1 Tax=Deinococcus arcticus TaxID=2136176 RepID=UPI0011B22901|nr:hypothetical protein [Deinococcus arcticus]
MKLFNQGILSLVAIGSLAGSSSAQDFWSLYIQTGADALQKQLAQPQSLPRPTQWSDLGLGRGTLSAPMVLYSKNPDVLYIRAPAPLEVTYTTPLLWHDQKVAAVAFAGVFQHRPKGDFSPEANPFILCPDVVVNTQTVYMSLDVWLKAAQAFDPTVRYELKSDPMRLRIYYTEDGASYFRDLSSSSELGYVRQNPVEDCYASTSVQANRGRGSFSRSSSLRQTAKQILGRTREPLDANDTIAVDGSLFIRYNPEGYSNDEKSLRKTLELLGDELPHETYQIAGQRAVKWVIQGNKIYLNMIWAGQVPVSPEVKFIDGAFYYEDALTDLPKDWKSAGYVLPTPDPDDSFRLSDLAAQWASREDAYTKNLWQEALNGAIIVDSALYFSAEVTVPTLQLRFEGEQLVLNGKPIVTRPPEMRVIDGARYLSASLLNRLGGGLAYDEGSTTLTLNHSSGRVVVRLSVSGMKRYTAAALAQRDQTAQEAAQLVKNQAEVKAKLLEYLTTISNRRMDGQEPAVLVDGNLYILAPRAWPSSTRSITPFTPVQGATTQPVSWRNQTYISLELLKAYGLEGKLDGSTLTLSHPATRTSIEIKFDKRGLRPLSLALLQKLWQAERSAPIVFGVVPKYLRDFYSALLLDQVGVNTYTIRSPGAPARVLVMTSSSEDRKTRKFCSLNGTGSAVVNVTRTNSGQYLRVEGASNTGPFYLPVSDVQGEWNQAIPDCLSSTF